MSDCGSDLSLLVELAVFVVVDRCLRGDGSGGACCRRGGARGGGSGGAHGSWLGGARHWSLSLCGARRFEVILPSLHLFPSVSALSGLSPD